MTQALQPGLLLQHGRYLYKIVAVEADSFSGSLVYPMQRRERIETFPLRQLDRFSQPSNKLLKAYNAAYGFPAEAAPQLPPEPPKPDRHQPVQALVEAISVPNWHIKASDRRAVKNLFKPRKTS